MKKPIISDWNLHEFGRLFDTIGKEKIVKIAKDKKRSIKERFFAYEILFLKDKTFSENSRTIASLYCKVLGLNDFDVPPNIWGLLPSLTNTSRTLINTKKSAIKPLIKLLEKKDVVTYWGSEEATMGYIYNYRICDLAAFFLSKIINFEIKIDQKVIDIKTGSIKKEKLSERNSQIRNLKKRLKELNYI